MNNNNYKKPTPEDMQKKDWQKKVERPEPMPKPDEPMKIHHQEGREHEEEEHEVRGEQGREGMPKRTQPGQEKPEMRKGEKPYRPEEMPKK